MLYLLHLAGGAAGRSQMIKWAFLLRQEPTGLSFYDFVPYLHGPFSFQLYREMDCLIRDGFVDAQDDKLWRLTDKGLRLKPQLPPELHQAANAIMRQYGHLAAKHLLDLIHARHPWYTIKIRRVAGREVRRQRAAPQVFTIGYEGFSIDGFLDRLLRRGIGCILDVRNNPVSRRYGFHRKTLLRLCTETGISYRSLPRLGVPSQNRRGVRTQDDYRALFQRYEKTILGQNDEEVEMAQSVLTSDPSVLLCREADPHACHRSYLAESLARKSNLPVVHLEWPR